MEGDDNDALAWTRETERLLWAVRVRWAVIGGMLGLALLLRPLGLFAQLGVLLLAAAIGVGTNTLNLVCVRRDRWVVAATVVAVSADNLLITWASACSGGLHSPLLVMYSVQVVATAMLVSTRAALLSAGLAALCAACLALLESRGLSGPHLLFAPQLLAEPARAARLGALAWSAFLADGLLLLVFVGGFISQRLRRTERRLATKNEELEVTLASLERAHDDLARAYDRLRQAEAQLLQTEKMRALGQLVAGVAHELNNPISFVSSNIDHLRHYCRQLLESLDWALDRLPASGRLEAEGRRAALGPVAQDLSAVLDDCEDGARRVKRIVAELRTFARADRDGDWSEVDLNLCVERTLRTLRHQLKQGVRLEVDLAELPVIEGRADQLEQVLLNLLLNAVDAVGDHGRVRVESEYDEEAATVRLRVADDGPGIAPENLGRVFEPFFTTKPVGQGTGIGLSLSYAIIQRHGGSLTVRSELGTGAVFEVSLPGRRTRTATGAREPGAIQQR
jgi:signal transduction histidine kinase